MATVPAGTAIEAESAVSAARAAFEWEKKIAGRMGSPLVVREPISVVVCITPWNFPLSQIPLKIAPPKVAGRTVVLKPSEIAPVNAMILAEIIHDAGLPPGVFKLVNGLGPVVGEPIATHPEVDRVSFTGSTRAGRRVSELASQSVKCVALELGSKSASVLLNSAKAQEEIFGPVLVVIPYNDEEDEVQIANSTMDDFGGAVWATSYDEALRLARRARTGKVDINGGPFDANAPFGGYKQSGNSLENGIYGFEEFLEFTSIQLKPVTV